MTAKGIPKDRAWLPPLGNGECPPANRRTTLHKLVGYRPRTNHDTDFNISFLGSLSEICRAYEYPRVVDNDDLRMHCASLCYQFLKGGGQIKQVRKRSTQGPILLAKTI